MEFNIKKCTKYVEVKVREGGTVIELGLLDGNERKELSLQLRQAADEIMDGLDE